MICAEVEVMPMNDVSAVFQSAPWFLPGTTDHTVIAEQALAWLLDNPEYARKNAEAFVPVLMDNPGPERMARWLLEQREHILSGRRARAAFLAL